MKKREVYQARILRLLSNYLTIEQIAKTLNKSPKTIYKAFSNYIKKGWINKDRTLTSNGIKKVENTIAISQKVEFQPNTIRLHNLVFKINIKKIKGWKNKEKLLNLRQISFKTINLGTWKTEQIVIDNRKIWLNPKRLILYMGDYYENTPFEAFEKSLQDMKGLIQKVEKALNLNLINKDFIDFEVSRQHYALIKNQLAEQYNKDKKKLFIYDDENRLRLLIDNSLNLKEFEAVHNEKSRDDSTKVQDHFRDLLEKESYKPSEIKEIIDRLAKENLILSQNVNIYHKEIREHRGLVKDIRKYIKVITNKEIKQRTLKEEYQNSLTNYIR